MSRTNPAGIFPTLDSQGNACVNAAPAAATFTVPSASGNVVGSAAAGRLGSVLVTATGSGGPTLIYDNATTNSGTVVGYIPASPTVGTVYNFNMPVANGIVVAGVASGPTLTVSYT